ncbi:hypothetical protein T02_12694 [Trichinella nativa]|uniref:Uncharacterized protein n=1 Tax=Trichinella nativa TaxID=6335 RepID=A0A0V1LDW2_9BILA|nr:hypothetical protein T02_12694 [Trichinella nativa]
MKQVWMAQNYLLPVFFGLVCYSSGLSSTVTCHRFVRKQQLNFFLSVYLCRVRIVEVESGFDLANAFSNPNLRNNREEEEEEEGKKREKEYA